MPIHTASSLFSTDDGARLGVYIRMGDRANDAIGKHVNHIILCFFLAVLRDGTLKIGTCRWSWQSVDAGAEVGCVPWCYSIDEGAMPSDAQPLARFCSMLT